MDLGNAIRVCRTRKKMKLGELAEKSNISASYLSLLEQGKRDPNISTITKISEAMNIPLSIFFFLAADRKTELSDLSPEIIEKLSSLTLELIGETKSD
jgi:transcriptional regulator with XRE-family HTH domain